MSHIAVQPHTTITRKEFEVTSVIQPMPFKLSALLFALTAVITVIAVYGLTSILSNGGESPLVAFTASFTVATALMFVAALVGYHKVEGRPLTWTAFRERMWFPRLQWRDVLWGFAAFLISGILLALLTMLRNIIIAAKIIPLPANIPLLIDPNSVVTPDTLSEVAGGSLTGQWGLLALYAVSYFFNNVGEELWWRGYVLPRQIARHDRYTWLIHGLMWAGFHLFKYWDILTILPLTLGIAYMSHRFKSNWASLIAHALGNITFFIIITIGVLGL